MSALDDFLRLRQGTPFDWLHWNCCLMVASWVHLRTGRWVMRDVPPTPTRQAAHRQIRRMGGSLRAVWTGWLGAEPIKPALAQPGDVVLVQAGADEAVGICCGRTAVVLTLPGLAHVPMAGATAAWRLT
jgi:hypothetical protein